MAQLECTLTSAFKGTITEADSLKFPETVGVRRLTVIAAGEHIKRDFPWIGASLPNIIPFRELGVAAGEITAWADEYGGQPDPAYFTIVGVDEDGNPIYSEENE